MDQTTSEEFSWSQALGGTRGAIEATTPGFLFVIAFVTIRGLLPTLVAASTVALVACVIRSVQHQGIGQALSGLFRVAIGVIFTVMAGRGENYLVWGIATNAAMALAFAPSVLCGRGLVAQFYGPLTDLIKGWQSDPAYASLHRSCAAITWMWARIFALRVAVQAPLWLAGRVAGLGVSKLTLGLPPFTVGAQTIWWGLKVYSSASSSSGSSGTGDTTS